ncbi:carboxypeptidase [Rheinheimera sp. SA_1]|uniref:M14 family metallopeptidase n=1 Tax=Rheinheimera sp. SA_1 TaxID=1827365 RepID=UPI0007FF2F68|nr:M14 family metallopeptidase [Rheinheimera sp. SA_1]OBP15294.1 carboxypeptidase [Rheinheimera sp. SA_1]
MKALFLFATTLVLPVAAADHLPPLLPWDGPTQALIQPQHPWVTPAELTDLTATPDYAQTISYLKKLVESSPLFRLEVVGQSPQGRDIYLVKASTQPDLVGKSGRPTLLVQAGIHSGEIDGKDAGLMLLRDIAHGDKAGLLAQVDLLFIPVLSVDAHERRGEHHRMNQRGPLQQGWRSNASNLNLNRDYAKADSLEMQALLKVLNQYQPDLYMDVHVTDGEDYQYDITYGFNEPFASLSPNGASWLAQVYRPYLDRQLSRQGHIPGPLVFGLDRMDFSKGLSGSTSTPRFSNGYGDVRHLPTILVENHSLKPYKQRVLGTYVLLEQTLKLLQDQGKALQLAKKADENFRPQQQVLLFKAAEQPELIHFKGISYEIAQSDISKAPYVKWTGQAKDYVDFPVYWEKVPAIETEVPSAYWIPPQYQDVIKRLEIHGVKMSRLTAAKTLELQQLVASKPEFAGKSFEGRVGVSATFTPQWRQLELAPGSVRVSTDQPLGALAVALLQPQAPDSFFSWGFFHGMFERTEYFETYAIIPWIEQQLVADPKLKQQFDEAVKADATLQKDGQARLDWFYQRSPFYDEQYLKYPVLLER